MFRVVNSILLEQQDEGYIWLAYSI